MNKGLVWFLKKYGWCIWLGIMMADIGLLPSQLEWWLFIVPLSLLIGVSKKQELYDKSNSSNVKESGDWKQ
jgi:hypothetical protein